MDDLPAAAAPIRATLECLADDVEEICERYPLSGERAVAIKEHVEFYTLDLLANLHEHLAAEFMWVAAERARLARA